MPQHRSKRPLILFSLPALVLLLGVGLLTSGVYARPNALDNSVATIVQTTTGHPSALSHLLAPESSRDGFAHLVPATGAPPNGGQVSRGTTFTVDLYINTGANQDATAAQSYITFDSGVLAVVGPNGTCSNIPSGTTIVSDPTRFEVVLQNEWCNAPTPCNFRGVFVAPGTGAYAAGALNNPATGGNFRVASITFCATNGGNSNIAFEFAPPAPMTRDSEIVVLNGDLVQNSSLYQTYNVTVSGPTATPGPPTWTPTRTFTPAPVRPTSTPGGGGTCAMNFSDVPSNIEFYRYIRDLYCRNPKVITGFADNTFRPWDPTKRAQICKMVVLAFNLPINTAGGPHFTDVTTDMESYRYIETLYNRNIITGFGAQFKPWDEVKRGQIAKIVVLAAGIAINTSGGPHFSDVPANNESYRYVETALNRNIITGFAGGTFHPYDNATRGQISKIIDRANGAQ